MSVEIISPIECFSAFFAAVFIVPLHLCARCTDIASCDILLTPSIANASSSARMRLTVRFDISSFYTISISMVMLEKQQY